MKMTDKKNMHAVTGAQQHSAGGCGYTWARKAELETILYETFHVWKLH